MKKMSAEELNATYLKKDLVGIAKELGLKNYSSLNKMQLAELISDTFSVLAGKDDEIDEEGVMLVEDVTFDSPNLHFAVGELISGFKQLTKRISDVFTALAMKISEAVKLDSPDHHFKGGELIPGLRTEGLLHIDPCRVARARGQPRIK